MVPVRACWLAMTAARHAGMRCVNRIQRRANEPQRRIAGKALWNGAEEFWRDFSDWLSVPVACAGETSPP